MRIEDMICLPHGSSSSFVFKTTGTVLDAFEEDDHELLFNEDLSLGNHDGCDVADSRVRSFVA